MVANLKVIDGSKGTKQEEELAELRKKLTDLKESMAKDFFLAGELLYRAYSWSAHLKWDYKFWRDYVKNEMEMSERKAQYLMSIYKWMRDECVGEAEKKRIIALGPGKIRSIVSVADKSNMKEWLSIAEKSNCIQLEGLVKEARDEAREKAKKDSKDRASKSVSGEDIQGQDEFPEDLTSITFKLYPKQEQAVEDAIEKAGQITESDKRGNLITVICEEYITGNIFQAKPGMRMMAIYLAKVAGWLDIRLIAAEKTGQFILGEERVVEFVSFLPEKVQKLVLKALLGDLGVDALSKKDRKKLLSDLSK